MSHVIPHLLNGLSLGLLFALIALGFMLIVGVMELINLAHGSLFALKAVHSTNVLIQRRILASVKGSDCFCYLIDGKTLSAFGTRVGGKRSIGPSQAPEAEQRTAAP